ncbi:MAG: DNA polymerase III subunit delta [Clostridiales bacterium]|nr:DNA polymerase III subunit delta [Clostridiales bacterium]
MKFEELKGSLQKNILPAYLLSGGDEYLLSSATNLIIKYSGIEYPELNIIKFVEGIIDCEDVVRALDTMPVFSGKKAVILDVRMAKKSEIKNVKALNQYLNNPNPMAVLIVSCGANSDDIGVDKKLVEVIDCSKVDVKIVEAKIVSIMTKQNKKISPQAIKLLIEYTLCDLAKIIVECDKLIAYSGQRGEITDKDIKEIVTRSIEYQVFELTESLAKKDSVKVYTILADMKAKKDEYKMLPALIYSHFRRLFHIALNQGASNLEISKMLGVKEYAVKMSQGQAKLFSKSALKKINELCSNTDYDLKQSNISLDNAIELIVLSILNMG